MDILFDALVALLGGAAGYFAGRWHGAAAQTRLKKQLEHDTEQFHAMLEERNESYLKYKATYADQTSEVKRLALEVDKLEQRLETQQAVEKSLRSDMAEQSAVVERTRQAAEQWKDERTGLREEIARLSVELDEERKGTAQRQAVLKSLQERFEKALQEKAALQAERAATEREAREYQRIAQKYEDNHDATELTLSQLRVAREELATKLAFAEGQLQAMKSQGVRVQSGTLQGESL